MSAQQLTWHRVSEITPEDGHRVLAAWRPGKMAPALNFAAYWHGRGWFVNGVRLSAPQFWAEVDAPNE